MKTLATLLALALTATFTLTAAAKESIAGTWQVQTVGNAEPPEGASLTLAFGDENKATITYTLAGESQAWHYTYAVADGQLNLEPAAAFGEPQTVTYDIKFDEEKLQLLTPKLESAEDKTEEEGEEAAEEEDNRVPVWVLTKA